MTEEGVANVGLSTIQEALEKANNELAQAKADKKSMLAQAIQMLPEGIASVKVLAELKVTPKLEAKIAEKRSDAFRIFQFIRAEDPDFIVFIKSVNNLHRAMHFLVSDSNSGSKKLVLAQNLMQIAMKRLENELYLISFTNRDCLDPEYVSNRSSSVSVSYSDDEVSGFDNEAQRAGEMIFDVEKLSVIAMFDLRLIADYMISSVYGKKMRINIQNYKKMDYG
ncbi:hypothetical protein LguiA_020395 [Lonicera macranthoides]